MKCPHCEREYTESEDRLTCPYCGNSLEPDDLPPQIEVDETDALGQPSQIAGQPRLEYCPWEDQENLGFFESMTQTVKQSLFSPKLFSSRLPKRGGLLQPLLYAVSLQMLGSFANFLWSMAFGNAVSQLIAMLGGSPVALALLIPVIVFLNIVLSTMAIHVSLLLVGGANEDFEATFRAICYTSGAEIFNVIPLVGGIIKSCGLVYILVVGLREVQGITTGKAIAAIVISLVFCCVVPVLGLMALLATAI